MQRRILVGAHTGGDIMSLVVFEELGQRSDAWYDQRRGMVTASAVGALITTKTIQPASNDYSRTLTALLVAERITGHTEPTFMSEDMFRGVVDEPFAIDVYSEHHAPVESCGFMVRDDWGFEIGFSPDGLVGDDGLVEVKSRRQKKHLQTILSDCVPAENVAQLQCGLLVSGREWVDYLSFCGGMPLWTKRVYPDPRWQAAIVAAVEQFEKAATVMVAQYRAATKDLPPTERVTEMEMTF
jgi:YqaJ-like viral recombinase domain